MLKSNFKKLVSAASSAAMLVSLAAPAVMAEGIADEDIAELNASGVALISQDFNDSEVGDVIVYSETEQDAYTGIEGLELYVGSGSNADSNNETKAAIVSGVGVDGSNALAFSTGAKGTTSSGPRMTFDVPRAQDYYTITFKVFPASDKQELKYNDRTANYIGSIALPVNINEWNDVEIHVSRVDSTRIFNVNGETVKTDTSDITPVIWGAQVSNAGEIYFDDIKVVADASMPTPIPTPSPEPIAKPAIGDKLDFNDYESGTVLYVQTTSQDPVEYKGFTFYIGNRGGGASTNTYIGFASNQGQDGSNAIVIANGQFYSTGRGGRVKLVEPEDAVDYKVTFKAKATGTDDISISSSTSSNENNLIGLTPDKWSEVTILMTNGNRIILVDGALSQYASTTSLPVIWGKDENSIGNIYIDDIEYSSLSNEEALNAFAAIIDIENENKTVFKNDDVYNFIESFPIPVVSVNKTINWSVGETADNGTTVSETKDLKIQGTNVVTVSPDPEKTYALTATVTDGDLVATKQFLIKYVPSENVVDTVIEALDIPTPVPTDSAKPSRKDNVYIDDTRTETYDGAEYTPIYEIRGDFSVPLSEWVASISWDSTNNKAIQIDKDGDIKVYPMSAEPVILTATVTYGNDTKTKSFYLDLESYYTTKNNFVQNELVNSVLYPKAGFGEQLTSVTLTKDSVTTIPFDVQFKSISAADPNLVIEWSSSDRDYLSNDGVIGVYDKEAHEITLNKKVSYVMDGEKVISDSVDYKVNIQFDPDETEAGNIALAEKYAASINADESSSEYKSAYNAAMEILSDRYRTRGDALYEGNFNDIPDSVDDDFDLPTEGYFGSKITWGSSDTSIKINGDTAKVTQPSSDKTVQLKATFTSGAASNVDAYSTKVEVTGTGKRSSGGGGGGSSSGGGNSYRGSLGTSAYVNAPTAAPVAPNASTVNNETVNIQSKFKDLLDVPWAAEAIEALAAKGVVSGKDDTRFAPNDNITRAELSKIIVGAFGIGTGAAPSFSDVAADAWYASFVGACADAGIVTGYEDGTFRPDNLVTRQEMAVMIKRAADFKGVAIDTPNAKADFTDSASIADYAADSIETLQRAGMINGLEDGSFAPKATATRAQAAKILYNFAK